MGTKKILEENTISSLFDINHRNFLLDTSPKAGERKAKIKYWDLKWKASEEQRKHLPKIKGTLHNGRRYLQMTSDKRFMSKIHKELTYKNLHITQLKSGQKTRINIFAKTYRWLTDTWKDVQHHSSSEKYKSTMRFHLIPLRMATVNNTGNNRYWWRCEERGPSYTVGENANWCNCSEKHCGRSLKN